MTKWISLVRHSYYYRVHPNDIMQALDKNDARRYLAQLCVENAQKKSNLIDIEEVKSNAEFSVQLKGTVSRGFLHIDLKSIKMSSPSLNKSNPSLN